MSTKSILKNIDITNSKDAKKFVDALDKAEQIADNDYIISCEIIKCPYCEELNFKNELDHFMRCDECGKTFKVKKVIEYIGEKADNINCNYNKLFDQIIMEYGFKINKKEK